MKYCCFCNQQIRGRIDKKFCDDGCRSSFHHQIQADLFKHIKKTHYILRKNRRIIAELFEQNQQKLHKSVLVSEGFAFSYHTQIIENANGLVQYVCYDYAYSLFENNQIQLHKIC
jgi:hypothetical protein